MSHQNTFSNSTLYCIIIVCTKSNLSNVFPSKLVVYVPANLTFSPFILTNAPTHWGGEEGGRGMKERRSSPASEAALPDSIIRYETSII